MVRLISVALLATTAAPALAASALSDGSFETPASSAGDYSYPMGSYGSWSYGGTAVVNGSGSSAWYGNAAPAGRDGSQFVALQSNGTVTQSFVATSKAMSLSWLNAGRPSYGSIAGNQTYAITLDGTQVSGTRSTISGQPFLDQGKVLNGLTVGQTYTLGFKGLTTADQTAFIDKVALVAAPHRANQIDNSSFESPLNPGDYEYFAGTKDGWNYNGSALVNGVGYSAWYGTDAPTGFVGTQFAALQGTSTLSQTFIAYNGKLEISWLAGGRPTYGAIAGNQSYIVELDGHAFTPTLTTTSGEAFTANSYEISNLSRGPHTLTFVGLAPTDQTAFIDAVTATAIPEPAVWLLMVGGFGLVGFARRRRAATFSA